MGDVLTRLYNHLLLPFSDLVCLFVDDLGGIAKVIERLRSWLHLDQQVALTGNQPWLLLVVSKDLTVNEQIKVRELVRTRKGVERRFRGYQIFNVTETVRQTRATKKCQNSPWNRIQAKIWSLSSISYRKREGLLFSVRHLSSFVRYAVDRFVDPGKGPLEVVAASRLKTPVAVDLKMHLMTFLKTMRNTEAVINWGIPIIASSFVLDHYPPGMHQFNPQPVFTTLYRRTCERIYDEWPRQEVTLPLPASFLDLLEHHFIEQYRQLRRAKSAAELHKNNLSGYCIEYSVQAPLWPHDLRKLREGIWSTDKKLMEVLSENLRSLREGLTTTEDTSACIFTTYNGVGQRSADTDYHVLTPRGGPGQIPLWEIIRCSTAAPCYFKPRQIDGVGTFQDGGLAFNNPAAIAVQEACALGAEPSIIVSLGTGVVKARSPLQASTRRFFQDSFPMRIFRAFWQGSSSHRAWQQLLRHTRSDSQSNLFRFDIEFEGQVPALDDVSEMQNMAKLAREEILHSPSLEPLVNRIRAELFFFELSVDAPFRFHNGVYLCAGRILCRLQPGTPEFDTFMCQLGQSSASLHVAHQRIIEGVWGSPGTNTQEQFHQEVSFQIKSRDQPFPICLATGDYHCHISGSPFTLEVLSEQQKLNATFGTADHRKRPIEGDEEKPHKAGSNSGKRRRTCS
ncbi:acyl transferase/acyl hydrolase/lysophospholipase [Apiospora marii]|uniref:Acyl transferase/acyl hydrolase/lysophospholipase n=1 Tax=Apiospora marii TaxID=335849 RepID=A0ABR1RJU4_9PEZI